MAKWTPSGLVADIRGKLGSDVYSFQRGVHYIKRHNANPNQPDSAKQQACRGYFSDLSGAFFHLSPTYKQMWWKLASIRGEGNTALSEFLRVNLFIYASGIAGLSRIDHPALSVTTPPHVEDFQVTATDSTQNVLSWSAPGGAAVFVQAWKQFDWNYFSGYNQQWVLLAADTASSLQIVHNHDTPSGERIWYKLRSFDAEARRSPFSAAVKITIPD
ncbi:MAG: hypothetical protein KAV00_03250 [Phycisphaerae bacterium]|nr:hypothetical protein [Phycisphaerae bacterium]